MTLLIQTNRAMPRVLQSSDITAYAQTTMTNGKNNDFKPNIRRLAAYNVAVQSVHQL